MVSVTTKRKRQSLILYCESKNAKHEILTDDSFTDTLSSEFAIKRL